ncbi:hypothetical protein B0H19DRAFT_1271190 [Mycena capillaripes]|nr:hypothetical protein B0H19DRAFT_1271190 [Mycena capillaripes]
MSTKHNRTVLSLLTIIIDREEWQEKHHATLFRPSRPSTATLTRVPELWLEDDNLILSAENSLFRVSKGVLAARSSVCRDVLAFPRPRRLPVAEVKAVKREKDTGEREETESDVTMDACPVVVQEHKLTVSPIHSIHPPPLPQIRHALPPPASSSASTPASPPPSHPTKSPGLRRAPPSSPSTAPPRSAPPGSSHRLPSTSSAIYSDRRVYIFNARECDVVRETVNHELHEAFLIGVLRARRAILAMWGGWNLSDPRRSYKEWSPFENEIYACCLEKSKAYHRATRTQLWEELPSMYGLPPVDALEKMKSEALAVDPSSLSVRHIAY